MSAGRGTGRRRGAILAASACGLVAVVLMAGRALADENHWQLLRPGGRAPQALQWAAFTQDPARNELLVFGGTDQSAAYNDFWVLDLSGESWSLVRPRGTLPYYRQQASMAFDVAGDRAVVFGGYVLDEGRPTYYDDTWLLELGGAQGPEWVKLPFAANKPAPRRDASLIYQPGEAGAGRMILFGGWNHVQRIGYDDLWAFDLTPGAEGWSRIGQACSGGPDPRDGHVAIYDPSGRRMLVFGGWLRSRSTYRTLDDLWAFDLSGSGGCWTELTPPSPDPPALAWSSAVYDACPSGRRMLLFGGFEGTGTANSIRGSDTNAVWSLALDLPGLEAWAQLDPGGARPRPRDAHAAALDSEGRRMIVYGGWENEGELLRDVWALELAPCGPPTETPTATPSPTASPAAGPSPTATSTVTPTDEPTPSPAPSDTPSGPPSATPDHLATAVAATLTAMAPTLVPTATPDVIGTSVAATLTAAAPTPSASPTPDAVGTAVAATLTAAAPPLPPLYLPWLDNAQRADGPGAASSE